MSMKVTAGLLLRGTESEHPRENLSLQRQSRLQADLEKDSTPDLKLR